MHEIEAWLLAQHVAVQGCHFDPVVAKHAKHWVDLLSEQDEVARDGGLLGATQLEIYGDRRTHRGGHGHAVIGDRLSAGKRVLQHAAIGVGMRSHDLVEAGHSLLDCGSSFQSR